MSNETTRVPLDGALAAFIASMEAASLGGVRPAVDATRAGAGRVNVKLRFELPEPVRQDDWRIDIAPAFAPAFHWAPHLTPTDRHIIDQHGFRSPALIVHDADRWLAVVPDLDLLLAGSPVRWYMDLNAKDNRLTLGMSRYRVAEHVLYEREAGAAYPAGTVEFGFFVLTGEGPDYARNPWRPVLDLLWSGWGGALFRAGEPIGRPLEPYVGHAYRWAFEDWKDAVWQQFELDGRTVGAPVFIVNVTQSPNYPGPVNEREFRSIWNQAWFSSLRSAQGLYRYGLETGSREHLERARLMKELALSAPQREGFFPAVIAAEMEQIDVGGRTVSRAKGWETAYWGNSNRNPVTRSAKEAPYHILDMSFTALLMLRWHEELERDERLLAYAERYGEALLLLQDGKGFFPAWLDAATLQPLPVLAESPETSMSVTFLLKLHELTGSAAYRTAALKAMDAVAEEIVPVGRWEDFETYWSCSGYGSDTLLGRKAERNDMYKQCNFSMFWTAEALLACHRTTGEERHLQLGERCLDELLMTQASWQPPYIHVNALGGFGVMNADGEWNDARQSLFAELILDYGQLLGRQEYVERGLAALRCAFVMMYCPENPRTKAQWEKAHPFFGERDYGFMMENYGHGGVADENGEGIGEFTIFDWGNGAAAEGFLRVKAHRRALLEQYGLTKPPAEGAPL
ncbi:hypothetical protein SAMN02799624_00600 [Paenibacillus sp. UNC496MF]|uniref:hypothetical protein n=1 Tax=Paenibacillus sp. UNC496MF TaxID=1502753 RepID=UPI0008DEC10A|nr:hypothetical protein [Paenibacillus sp. UNC496MF]SFI36258.1 hypothetical protein SAMN02799624_00600 [Paenibacillus sp. UNC496MF]